MRPALAVPLWIPEAVDPSQPYTYCFFLYLQISGKLINQVH